MNKLEMLDDFKKYAKTYSSNTFRYSSATYEGCELLENFLKKYLEKKITKSKSFEEQLQLLGLSEWWNFKNLINLKLPWEDAFDYWIDEMGRQ